MALSLYKDKSYKQKAQPGDVVALVDELLTKAVDVGASDIHFEPTSSDLVVKFRLDGVLNTVESLPKVHLGQRNCPVEGSGRASDISQ